MSDRLIYVHGFSRGGTNILWNILQSHPDVVSPIEEVNVILGRKSNLPKFLQRKLQSTQAYQGRWAKVCMPLVARRFEHWKQKTLSFSDNMDRTPGVPYTPAQVAQAALCPKGIDWDIVYKDLFAQVYPTFYGIHIIRNGYALCNGWVRRGLPIEEAAQRYLEIGQRMISDATEKGHLVIRFEDMISQPFGTAAQVYHYCNLTPTQVEKLRLKVKKTLSQQGAHETRYGKENKKYWFDPSNIFELLDPSIDSIQMGNLSEEQIAYFTEQTRPVLAHFNYLAPTTP